MSQKIIATNKNIKAILLNEIQRLGNKADLNHIDVSNVNYGIGLFHEIKFNGDISRWNVLNFETMSHMFLKSEFNGDISQWDVSNVKDMDAMFFKSKFNGDVSNWNVSNVKTMDGIFMKSPFDGDVSNWAISSDCVVSDALSNCPAAKSEHFGLLHLICKAEAKKPFHMHPDAEVVWKTYAPVAQSMGLEGPELGRAVWTSYQASLASQVTCDDLVNMDFTLSTERKVGCDPKK